MKKTLIINGVKVQVWTTKKVSPRFGNMYLGHNDYGESKMDNYYYSTKKEAFDNEIRELKKFVRNNSKICLTLGPQ